MSNPNIPGITDLQDSFFFGKSSSGSRSGIDGGGGGGGSGGSGGGVGRGSDGSGGDFVSGSGGVTAILGQGPSSSSSSLSRRGSSGGARHKGSVPVWSRKGWAAAVAGIAHKGAGGVRGGCAAWAMMGTSFSAASKATSPADAAAAGMGVECMSVCTFFF